MGLFDFLRIGSPNLSTKKNVSGLAGFQLGGERRRDTNTGSFNTETNIFNQIASPGATLSPSIVSKKTTTVDEGREAPIQFAPAVIGGATAGGGGGSGINFNQIILGGLLIGGAVVAVTAFGKKK